MYISRAFDRAETLAALPPDLAELLDALDVRLYYSGIDNYGTVFETRESRFGPGPGIGQPWTWAEIMTRVVYQDNVNNSWGWYIPRYRHGAIPTALWDVLGLIRLRGWGDCTPGILAQDWQYRQSPGDWAAYINNWYKPHRASPDIAMLADSVRRMAGDEWFLETMRSAAWREQ